MVKVSVRSSSDDTEQASELLRTETFTIGVGDAATADPDCDTATLQAREPTQLHS
jgi:hypothetical protein